MIIVYLYRFVDGTYWPDLHWLVLMVAVSVRNVLCRDLNIQLVYFPVYTSNHVDLGESLLRLLDR